MVIAIRNLDPVCQWEGGKVEIDLSRGLVNFMPGFGATPESGFHGTSPCLLPEQERELKARIYRGESVYIRDLSFPAFELVYRWNTHILGRDFFEVGRNSGCYESESYGIYTGAERNWSGSWPMQVIMCVTGVKLTNTRDRTSLSQAAFVQPQRVRP